MPGLRVWLLLLFIVCLPAATPFVFQSAPGPARIVSLRVGDVVHKQLAESEDRFAISLDSGVYLDLAVLAEAPLRVALANPAGGDVLTAVAAAEFEIPVSIVSREAGRYTVRIGTAEKRGAGTCYRLRVRQIRSALPTDTTVVAADELVRKASTRVAGGQAGALEDLESARRLYEKANARERVARVLIRSGMLRTTNDAFGAAAGNLEAAVKLSREIGDPELESPALAAASTTYFVLGKGTEALAASKAALETARRTHDPWLENRALVALGDALYSAQLSEALQMYLQAAASWRDLHWKSGEAEALLNAGYAYTDMAQERKALEVLTRAAEMWKDLANTSRTAETLRNIGLVYSKLDDQEKALEYYLQAKELLPRDGARRDSALTASAIGWIYYDLGDLSTAERYFRQALDSARRIRYPMLEGAYLHEVGLVSFEKGDFEGAREHYEASLKIFTAIGDLRWAAILKLEVGLALLRLGKTEEALQALNDALASIRENGGPYIEAKCLDAIGQAHHERGEYGRALEFYNQALALNRAGNYRYGEARTLFQLARLARDRGDLEQARAQFESAFKVVETVRTHTPGHELRTAYFSSSHKYIEFYIDLLMELQRRSPGASYDAAAFQMLERGHARTLLESLTEARVQIREGVDPGLLERERELKGRLNRVAERQMAAGGNGRAESEALARELDNLTAEYAQIEASIRTNSPKYAALTQPEPLTLAQVQHELLDQDTVIIEYVLGEQQTYLWVIGADSYSTFRLAGRKQIEDAVRELRDLLTAYETRPGETTRERRLRIQEARTHYWEKAAALSETLLGQAAGAIAGKRLVIVPDGALEYLPFAALPEPNRPAASAPVPLVVEHELVLLPSASTLAVLRNETVGRPKANKSLAVLADPVFDLQDPRLAPQRAHRSRIGPAPGVAFPRLASTRTEAEAISKQAPGAGVMTAVGFDASRELATSAELANYRIVHFATHSIVNYEHPELSGVALSMFGRDGKAEQGLLRLHDIYNLRLPVDLVVLSACQSYLGKQVPGEGLQGIVRGFMYAGTSRVIASLWKVDDVATKELMVRFYRNLFEKRQSPAAALRSAQIEMWQQPEWNAAYHWAAFVLQGEWRWE